MSRLLSALGRMFGSNGGEPGTGFDNGASQIGAGGPDRAVDPDLFDNGQDDEAGMGAAVRKPREPVMPRETGELPPLGMIEEEDHAAIANYIDGLAQEAADARAEYLDAADRNIAIYTWGDETEPDDDQVVSNEIQNAVIAIADLQTREPIRPKLDPVETGEPPTYFWAGPVLQPTQAMQPIPDPVTGGSAMTEQPLTGTPVPAMRQVTQPPPYGMTPDQMGPWLDADGNVQEPTPLRIEQGEAIAEDIRRGATLPDGRPLSRRWLVALDDKLVAQTYQTPFDVLWRRSNTDPLLRRNTLWNNVEGWQVWLYEWDDDRKRHRVTPLSVKQSYLDPTVEDLAEMDYCGIDYYLDAAKAKRIYPHLADLIAENAKAGRPSNPTNSNAEMPSAWDRNFQRPTILLRVWWLRHQPIPLTLEQATDAGAVKEVRKEVSAAKVDELGNIIEPAMVRMVTMFGDTEIDPSAEPGTYQSLKDWPVRYGTRQLTILVNTSSVVDDRECEHWDIPLLHNVAIPLRNIPYGQGEPYRLRKMQKGHTKALTGMVDHIAAFGHPLTAMSKSMYEATKSVYPKGRKDPAFTIIVPDDIWRDAGGRVDNVIMPPALSPGTVQAQQILRSTMREDSGYTNMLRGLESGKLSGVAITSLQNAAASQIGFKSQKTGDMAWRLSMLMLHSIVHRMTVEDLGRIVSRYPIHVLRRIHERARMMEWDVSVTVSTGSGMLQEQKKAEARADFQAGLITLETAHERMNIDHAQEIDRARAASQQVAPQSATGGAPGEGAGEGMGAGAGMGMGNRAMSGGAGMGSPSAPMQIGAAE